MPPLRPSSSSFLISDLKKHEPRALRRRGAYLRQSSAQQRGKEEPPHVPQEPRRWEGGGGPGRAQRAPVSPQQDPRLHLPRPTLCSHSQPLLSLSGTCFNEYPVFLPATGLLFTLAGAWSASGGCEGSSPGLRRMGQGLTFL